MLFKNYWILLVGRWMTHTRAKGFDVVWCN